MLTRTECFLMFSPLIAMAFLMAALSTWDIVRLNRAMRGGRK